MLLSNRHGDGDGLAVFDLQRGVGLLDADDWNLKPTDHADHLADLSVDGGINLVLAVSSWLDFHANADVLILNRERLWQLLDYRPLLTDEEAGLLPAIRDESRLRKESGVTFRHQELQRHLDSALAYTWGLHSATAVDLRLSQTADVAAPE